ncbi:MAG: hypothetical protein R3Y51_01680 [Rikenellaceae bacterium]
MQKLLYIILKTILAITFIFSGFVKAVEPMGTAIKFDEYFLAFNLESLTFLSPFLSIILPAFELLLGMLLLVNIYKKTVGFLTLLFMSFFTILTCFIYVFDPVSDCGCFGDAFIISNGQTLVKNVILLAMALYVCFVNMGMGRRNRSDVYVCYVSNLSGSRKRSDFKYFILLMVFSLLNPIYAYVFHPVIEFLPYKIGININELTEFKASDTVQEPLMLYKNKETLETQTFKLTDTEWQDTLKWEFIELVDNVQNDDIVSFDVIDEYGVNIARTMLYDSDTTIFIVSRNIFNLENHIPKIHEIRVATKNKYSVAVLTTSNIRDGNLMLSRSSVRGVSVYNMDETMIKSLVRAEVGVVAIGGATVLSKNNIVTMPTIDDLGDFRSLFSWQSIQKVVYIIINVLILGLIYVFLLINRYKHEKD